MTKNLADERQRAARQALSSLNPAPQGEEPGGLPLRRLLAAAFRARYLVFATTLFGLLIGAFLAITTPNTYISVGKFQFTATGAEARLLDPGTAAGVSQETIGNTAPHILNTDDLLIRVIDRLGPGRILAPYQPGLGDETGARAWFYQVQRDWNATTEEPTKEEALKLLRRSLMIETPRGQPVLIATFRANSPQLAQEILDTYMSEAVAWHIALYDDKRAYDDAQKVYEESKDTLESARRALREFLSDRAAVTDFETEKERLVLADSEAANRESLARQDLESARASLEQIHRMLEVDKSIPPTKPEKRRIDITTETRAELSRQLAIEMATLKGLEPRYRDKNDPRIVEARNTIESLKGALQTLEEEARNAPFEEVEVENPEYLALSARRQELAADVVQYEARVGMASEIAKSTHQRLLALLSHEPEYIRLKDALEQATDHAESSKTKWFAAQQKRILGQGNYSSLKPIQQASMPLEKEGPNRSKLLLGGFFAGLFIGLGIVILRALPDNVVRTRDDLERIEGLAVIGVLPRLDGTNLRRHVWLREQGW